jgi:hypothetical protein
MCSAQILSLTLLILIEVLNSFPLIVDSKIVHHLRHKRFFPNPYQFVIYCHPIIQHYGQDTDHVVK